jgi:hypothetical protein
MRDPSIRMLVRVTQRIGTFFGSSEVAFQAPGVTCGALHRVTSCIQHLATSCILTPGKPEDILTAVGATARLPSR